MRSSTLAVLASVVALSGCRAATEITVDVRTDASICLDDTTSTIAVGTAANFDGRNASASRVGCSGGGLGTLVITPSDSKTDEVGVKVVMGVTRSADDCVNDGNYAECIVARRILRFVPHENLRVIVPMSSSCEGKVCDPESTCVAGGCVAAKIVSTATCATSAGCSEDDLGPTASAGSGGAAGGGAAGSGGESAGSGGAAGSGGESAGGSGGAGAAGSGGASAAGAGGASIVMPALGYPIIAVSDESACVVGGLTADDPTHVVCWGDDNYGELGVDTAKTKVGPVIAGSDDGGGVTGIVRLGGVDTATLALDGTGTLFGWGNLTGIASVGVVQKKAAVLAQGILAFDAGLADIFTLDGNGTLGSFVNSQSGGSGFALGAAAPTSAPLPGAEDPLRVVASGGNDGGCAANTSNVWCWASSGVSELIPNGASTGELAPVAIATEAGFSFDHIKIAKIAVANRHALALLADGTVASWGSNAGGRARPGPMDGEFLLADLVDVTTGGPPLSGIADIAATHYASCGVTTDGGVLCWGAQVNGEQGDGVVGAEADATPHDPHAVLVGASQPLTGVVAISGFQDSFCAVKNDGSVWCWGDSSNHQASLTSATPVAFATQIPGVFAALAP